jgi:hypothetical protein
MVFDFGAGLNYIVLCAYPGGTSSVIMIRTPAKGELQTKGNRAAFSWPAQQQQASCAAGADGRHRADGTRGPQHH